MNKKLYVGNLPFSAEEAQLKALFGSDGRECVSAKIMMDRETGRSRGFAFIEMANPEDAQKALDALHGHEFLGRPLSVTEAREQAPRTGGFGGPRPGGFSGGGLPRPNGPGGPPAAGGGGGLPRPNGPGGPPPSSAPRSGGFGGPRTGGGFGGGFGGGGFGGGAGGFEPPPEPEKSGRANRDRGKDRDRKKRNGNDDDWS